MMNFWAFVVFVLGACIGSFLNVCIWRIPRDESIFSPPSRCPACGHWIRCYENIPLLSWIFLRGKCSQCGVRISFRYFFVELLTGVLFLLVWLKIIFEQQPLVLAVIYFAVTMLVVTTIFIDIEHRIIPDETTYPVMLTGLVIPLIFPEVWGRHSRLDAFLFSFAGFFVALIFSLAFSLIGKRIFRREALGLGDVKFLAAIGACFGLPGFIFILFIGSLLGSVGGIIKSLIRKKKLRRLTIPFGPYLAFAAYLWMLYGQSLAKWYLEFIHHAANLLKNV
ncbi:MAG: hypothetical protein A2020_01575 [Lentisphaerae bacterium GWF2_45_14]|nr:MAG: hypothetical protein A2020_01575 [Lentisphaerae bacterium GWF2_45_14]